MVLVMNGQEYKVNTTLRVAFQMQSEFGHKPYMQILQDVDKLKLEQQIKLLYIGFNLANPNVMTFQQFLDYWLDNGAFLGITKKMAELVEAITYNGMTPEEIEASKKEGAGDDVPATV